MRTFIGKGNKLRSKNWLAKLFGVLIPISSIAIVGVGIMALLPIWSTNSKPLFFHKYEGVFIIIFGVIWAILLLRLNKKTIHYQISILQETIRGASQNVAH
ncbi:MAG: hypothetical protein ACJAWV_003801 [Flammeovirgaceae bacterium]|jgi:hypothetical protein